MATSQSASDYTERLSRKVLSSLKSLNESLGEVRRSVQKIDAVANARAQGSPTGASASPSAAQQRLLPLLNAAQQRHLQQSPEEVTPAAAAAARLVLRVPVGSEYSRAHALPPQPQPQQPPLAQQQQQQQQQQQASLQLSSQALAQQMSAPTSGESVVVAAALSGLSPLSARVLGISGAGASAIAPPVPAALAASRGAPAAATAPAASVAPAPSEAASAALTAATLVRRVLMSPAFRGVGVDEGTLDELASVLLPDDMGAVRQHMAFRPTPSVAAGGPGGGGFGDRVGPLTFSGHGSDTGSVSGGSDGGSRTRTPGSTHSRAHTPPPPSWHMPGAGPGHFPHEPHRPNSENRRGGTGGSGGGGGGGGGNSGSGGRGSGGSRTGSGGHGRDLPSIVGGSGTRSGPNLSVAWASIGSDSSSGPWGRGGEDGRAESPGAGSRGRGRDGAGAAAEGSAGSGASPADGLGGSAVAAVVSPAARDAETSGGFPGAESDGSSDGSDVSDADDADVSDGNVATGERRAVRRAGSAALAGGGADGGVGGSGAGGYGRHASFKSHSSSVRFGGAEEIPAAEGAGGDGSSTFVKASAAKRAASFAGDGFGGTTGDDDLNSPSADAFGGGGGGAGRGDVIASDDDGDEGLLHRAGLRQAAGAEAAAMELRRQRGAVGDAGAALGASAAAANILGAVGRPQRMPAMGDASSRSVEGSADATLPTSSAPAAIVEGGGPAAPPTRIFTFTRYEGHDDEIGPDAVAEDDVPYNVEDVPLHDFYAAESAAASSLPAASMLSDDEQRARPLPLVLAGQAPAPGLALLAAGVPMPPMSVADTTPQPRVLDWNGSDVEWTTAPAAASSLPPAASASRPNGHLAPAPRHEAFSLRIVYEAGRTGFEEEKEFEAAVGSIIAGRYRVVDYIGSAAFSSALSCTDLVSGDDVCLKVIKNSKDFLDQSLDEIKLLRYINAQGDADAHNILRLREYFYYKEHLFIVTELLKDNLYEFGKYLVDNGHERFFTLPRIQRIALQTLRALAFIHARGLLHCDLKPENILIKSYSRCDVKVIDFGSSCFFTDRLSGYIQSRSYRAPEVVLGLRYGPKIDIWSLGAILCELLTGRVLFANDSVQTMLARIQSLLGPFPARMLAGGRDVHKYFRAARDGTLFERKAGAGGSEASSPGGAGDEGGETVSVLSASRTNLRVHLACEDAGFLDFVAALLAVDPDARPTAQQALGHPWLRRVLEVQAFVLPQ